MIRDPTEERVEGKKACPVEPPGFKVAGIWRLNTHDLDECIQRQESTASPAKPHRKKAK